MKIHLLENKSEGKQNMFRWKPEIELYYCLGIAVSYKDMCVYVWVWVRARECVSEKINFFAITEPKPYSVLLFKY